MTNLRHPVNNAAPAPLKNVAACMVLVNRLIERPPSLPGLGVMYGHSGYGKSLASIYAQNKTGAIRVEVLHVWRAKDLLGAILKELSVTPRGTIASLNEQVIELMGENPRRPLIIDEADKLVDNNLIEIVRGIHEHSQAPVLMIGEERFPHKLERIERVHNRVLDWLPAQPCDHDDASKLAAMFLPGVTLSPVQLAQLIEGTGGRARRIVKTLSDMSEWLRNSGSSELADGWNSMICTGKSPKPRGRT